MEIITTIFGAGNDLNALQMSSRAIVVFLAALLFIRISGRRSFGLRTPLDNIVAILLGAILSRAVVGASGFIAVMVCCLVIVLLHRGFGWLIAHSKRFGKLVEGQKIELFKDGQFIDAHMKRALLCKEDLMQGLRKSALTEDMDEIDKVYIERNGDISAIRKAK